MENQKHYVVDTNVLLDDPNALLKLRNGSENIVHIPYHVLLELNKFKKDPRLGHIVTKIVKHLSDSENEYTVLKGNGIAKSFSNLVDNYILDEIQASDLTEPILVTNDRMLQLQARLRGIQSETYKDSAPFRSETEHHNGFVQSREEIIANAFMWNGNGKPIFFGPDGEKTIDYQHKVWNVAPRNIYQNLALELLVHPNIHIVSIQSEAGYGKSFLALATALYFTLEKKMHEKIYAVLYKA